MSLHYDDTTLKIGSKVGGGGGGGPRETTIKGKSALNAAQRSGAVLSTEKKYSSANAASSGADGQRLTKIDREDGPVATKKVTDEVSKALAGARTQLKNAKGNTMTQKDLASKANVDVAIVAALERTGADLPAIDPIQKVEKAANIRLTGRDIGQPKFGPKKQNTLNTPAAQKDNPKTTKSPIAGQADGKADVVSAGGTTTADAA